MADCSRKRKTSGAPKTNLCTLRDNLWNVNFNEKLNEMKKEVQEFCTSFLKWILNL